LLDQSYRKLETAIDEYLKDENHHNNNKELLLAQFSDPLDQLKELLSKELKDYDQYININRSLRSILELYSTFANRIIKDLTGSVVIYKVEEILKNIDSIFKLYIKINACISILKERLSMDTEFKQTYHVLLDWQFHFLYSIIERSRGTQLELSKIKW